MRRKLTRSLSTTITALALLFTVSAYSAKADISAPGKPHEVLSKLEGNWDYVLKWWDGNGTPAISEGTSDKELIMDGRYLTMKHKGTWEGKAFEGFGIKSYDNVKEEYGTVWIDNLGTGLSVTSGSYDTGTNKLTESGTTTFMASELPYKGVTTFVDEDTYTYEYFITDSDGSESLKMVIMYKKNNSGVS